MTEVYSSDDNWTIHKDREQYPILNPQGEEIDRAVNFELAYALLTKYRNS